MGLGNVLRRYCLGSFYCIPRSPLRTRTTREELLDLLCDVFGADGSGSDFCYPNYLQVRLLGMPQLMRSVCALRCYYILHFLYQEPQEPQIEVVPQGPTKEEQMQNQLAEQLQLPALAATGGGIASAGPPPHVLGAQVCSILTYNVKV